jgi:hypothetical protein
VQREDELQLHQADDDQADEPSGEDCDRCGGMIMTNKMGKSCDTCMIYYHKTCKGGCRCVPKKVLPASGSVASSEWTIEGQTYCE